MKVLIVYDSFFGNTEKVARTLENTLKSKHDVKVRKVGNERMVDVYDSDLIIIGSPTRVFEPTKAIKSFVKMIDFNKNSSLKTLVFDTRMDIEKVNVKILKFLEKKKKECCVNVEKYYRKEKRNTFRRTYEFLC